VRAGREDVAIGGQRRHLEPYRELHGLPTGISGADLVWRGEVQAMKFGTRFRDARRVVRLESSRMRVSAPLSTTVSACAQRPWWSPNGRAVPTTPLDRLAEFEGAGIFIMPRPYGGAATARERKRSSSRRQNSAGQAAMFLSRSARCVRVLVRGASLAGFDVELPLQPARSGLLASQSSTVRNERAAWYGPPRSADDRD